MTNCFDSFFAFRQTKQNTSELGGREFWGTIFGFSPQVVLTNYNFLLLHHLVSLICEIDAENIATHELVLDSNA